MLKRFGTNFALASLATLGLSGCRTPTDSESTKTLAKTFAVDAGELKTSSVGCGVSVEREGGAVELVTIPRTSLPNRFYAATATRGLDRKREVLRIVLVEAHSTSGGDQVTTVCAVPDGLSEQAINELRVIVKALTQSSLPEGGQVKRRVGQGKSQLGDWQLDALFGDVLSSVGAPQQTVLAGC